MSLAAADARGAAAGSGSSQHDRSAWMDSPHHRSNVLHSRLKFAGVGAAYGIPVNPRLPGATITMARTAPADVASLCDGRRLD